MRLLLATHNAGKRAELCALLSHIPGITLLTAHEQPFSSVEETGKTFLENALLKARAVSRETGLAVLAEDAGLEVDALDGAPGVRSARFSGLPVDHARNNALLLDRLGGRTDRQARFVAWAVLRLPDGREYTSQGTLPGRIATAARGEEGFGYDPLFIPDGEARTLAQIPLEEKNRTSHRRRAIDGLKGILLQLAYE